MVNLITGGTGSVGTELAHQLVAQGEEVVLFDIAINKARINDIENDVKIIQGDLGIYSEIFNAVKDSRADVIYHLGFMLSGYAELQPWTSFHANITGTMNVLEAARLFNVKKVLYTSSISVFLDNLKGKVDDYTAQRPMNIYGCQKIYTENIGCWYRSHFGLDFRGVRYPLVVSPAARAEYHWWSHIFVLPAMGKSCHVPFNEKSVIPLLHGKDAASSLIQLCRASSDNLNTVNYNVASITGRFTFRNIAEIIKKRIPNAKIAFDSKAPMHLNVAENLLFDDSYARKEWGWQPRYDTVEKILEDVIDEVHSHPEYYEIPNKTSSVST